jgi:alcohol dehydrogenase
MTAHFSVPHGLACAFTMPAVLRHNLNADDGRFKRLARVVSFDKTQKAEILLEHFDALNQQLNVAGKVREMIGSLDALAEFQDQMFTPGRADNTLESVSPEAIKKILEQAWGEGAVNAE